MPKKRPEIWDRKPTKPEPWDEPLPFESGPYQVGKEESEAESEEETEESAEAEAVYLEAKRRDWEGE